MEDCTHIFQISGIKIREKKRVLVQGIRHLGGKYIGGSVYQHSSTHLIIPQVLSSEKFLAACAAGKWVVTPDYVLDSVKNGSWLAEGLYEVAISTCATSTFYPVRQWREMVASGKIMGAFQGWRVLLMIQEPTRRAMFKRLLKAGRAKVYHSPPPSHASVTHVMAKPLTVDSKSHNAPCYPVTHIVQHLFGSNCVDMKFNKQDDHSAEAMKPSELAGLETELKNYVVKHEGRPRLMFPEFLGCQDPYCPQPQVAETDFSNIGTMIECGLFSEALDSVRSALVPGLLPPVPYLASLLEYAQKGHATSVFVTNLQKVLYNLLLDNYAWFKHTSMKKYFTQVLQCPRCRAGPWPFLHAAISYCLSGELTCHQVLLPGPALPTLIRFHSGLLAFFLKLFQGELHSVCSWDFLLHGGRGVPQGSASGCLLYGTFWTIWERSTLLTGAVKQLIQLLVQAAMKDYTSSDDTREVHLADSLIEVLSVLVEFWCQQHVKLNPKLVDKGLTDIAEHFAVASHDVSPAVLAEIIIRIHFTRLKLVIADAIFRFLCCRNGFPVQDEPLSLKKMMLSYLPALGNLARSSTGTRLKPGQTSLGSARQGSSFSARSSLVNEASLEKENIPRGLNRVNTAGETLLHRACKRNQVQTVLQILALPGTDVNIRDHAGWTPLHEACNHGSTSCVDALLRHLPAPELNSQVGGVSPLHDAVLNGHMDIAKMLLEHAGSVLLQQTDHDGMTPLDLVPASNQRETLLRSAEVGDAAVRNTAVATEVLNLPLLELGSTLLAQLIFSYQQEKGLSGFVQLGSRRRSLVRALEVHSLQKVISDWTDQKAARLAEDVQTLLELSRGDDLGQTSRVVKECKGENTRFLMEIIENLKCLWRHAIG